MKIVSEADAKPDNSGFWLLQSVFDLVQELLLAGEVLGTPLKKIDSLLGAEIRENANAPIKRELRRAIARAFVLGSTSRTKPMNLQDSRVLINENTPASRGLESLWKCCGMPTKFNFIHHQHCHHSCGCLHSSIAGHCDHRTQARGKQGSRRPPSSIFWSFGERAWATHSALKRSGAASLPLDSSTTAAAERPFGRKWASCFSSLTAAAWIWNMRSIKERTVGASDATTEASVLSFSICAPDRSKGAPEAAGGKDEDNFQ
jgi:hypothetical protein